MIILQIAQDTIQNAVDTISSHSNPSGYAEGSLLYIEKIILILFVAFQWYIFFKVRNRINKLKNTFSGKILIEFNDDNIPYLSTGSNKNKQSIIYRIQDSINKYLKQNYGSAVNFSIIKDIIDRETDLENDSIQQSISVPLYIGLAATMIGIILGLWAMPDISSTDFTNSISVLINGVKWAMSASLMGLLLTTILSTWIYKPAIQSMLKDKSLVLSMLQADLLPELVKADETGFSGLKTSLERFSRQAEEIVNSLHNAVDKTGLNIKGQLVVLKKVEEMDIQKMSQAVVLQYQKLDKNIQSLDNLYQHLSQIEQISYNLKEFAKQSEDMTAIGRSIKENVSVSTEHIHFIQSHFDKLEKLGNYSLQAINLSDSHFRDAIEKLTDEINQRIANLDSLSNQAESHLKEIYEKIINDLDRTASQHIQEFTQVYKDSVPKFESLKYLASLEEIKKELKEYKRNDDVRTIISKIEQLIRVEASKSNSVVNKKTGKKRENNAEPNPKNISVKINKKMNTFDIIANAWKQTKRKILKK